MDFTIRSDSIDVEQIMEQVRARIREKRGTDYTEQEIRELASVKLEKFLDPRGVRSNLLEQFRQQRPPYEPPELPNFAFGEGTLFDSHRWAVRWIRRLLRPVLKLLFNPNPLIQALNIQSRLNALTAERTAQREAARHDLDQLHYEVLHNLVLELTRLGIEAKNLRMRVESLAGRLDFNERRVRALEGVVVYQPESAGTSADAGRSTPPAAPSAAAGETPAPPPAAGTGPSLGPGQRSRRRRRRRGRRSGTPASTLMGGAPGDHGQPVGTLEPSAAAPTAGEAGPAQPEEPEPGNGETDSDSSDQ